MTDVNFYEGKIVELTENLRESVRSVCSIASDIEKDIEGHCAENISSLLENLSHESSLARNFSDSIYFLTRLLRDKTKA